MSYDNNTSFYVCKKMWMQEWYGFIHVKPLVSDTCACRLSCFSHVWLFVTLWTIAPLAPLSMGFSRQEHGSGLPCPPPGDLPTPSTESTSLMSPASAGGVFTTSATWETARCHLSSFRLHSPEMEWKHRVPAWLCQALLFFHPAHLLSFPSESPYRQSFLGASRPPTQSPATPDARLEEERDTRPPGCNET